MDRPAVEVIHIGSASRDLADDDPRGWRLGGGATYASLTTARLGLSTAAIIGLDAVAMDALELDALVDAGVQLLRVPLPEAPVFENVEREDGRIQTSIAVGVPLPTPVIPADWRDAPAWSLLPIARELTEAWVERIPERAHVTVGWQGLLRQLHAGRPVLRRRPTPSPIVRRADLVGLSRHDIDPNTRDADLSRLLHPGAELLITEGLAGGRLLQIGPDGPTGARRYRATPASAEVDATGAGDVFLASLQATRIRPRITGRGRGGAPATDDLAFAAAAASLVVEGHGVWGVPTLDGALERLERDRPG